jgi:hypothetical protein
VSFVLPAIDTLEQAWALPLAGNAGEVREDRQPDRLLHPSSPIVGEGAVDDFDSLVGDRKGTR